MNKQIYEERAEHLNSVILDLVQSWDKAQFDSDEDGKGSNYILSQIERMVKIEQANAQILLKAEESDLKDREITLQEVVSDEKRKADERTDETRRLELDVRKQELEANGSNKTRELDIREEELKLDARRRDDERLDAETKEALDREKLKTERAAVKGRVIGEAIGAIARVAGVIGTMLSLRTAIQFEHDDEGGILPAKFISTIFKMSK